MPSKSSIADEYVRSKQAVKHWMHMCACIYKDQTQREQNSERTRLSVNFWMMM